MFFTERDNNETYNYFFRDDLLQMKATTLTCNGDEVGYYLHTTEESCWLSIKFRKISFRIEKEWAIVSVRDCVLVWTRCE